MKNINPPDIDAKEAFHSVIKKKGNKNIFIDMETIIFWAYNLYAQNALNMQTIAPLSLEDNIKKEFIKLYDNPTIWLDKIKECITLSLQWSNRCPYCNLEIPHSFDHFLPKNRFPEFSVLPINLIPCCDCCNRKKWSKDPIGWFINAYFDQLPQCQFITAEISINENIIVNFKIDQSAISGISNSLKEKIINHFTNLDLNARYKLEIENTISEIVSTCRREETLISNELLLREAERYRSYWVNNWKYVLLIGLSDSLEAQEYLNLRAFPDNIKS